MTAGAAIGLLLLAVCCDAVAGWVKSPGHCANLMNPGFTEMGAGLAIDRKSELGMYWAQAFGTPRGSL